MTGRTPKMMISLPIAFGVSSPTAHAMSQDMFLVYHYA